MKAMRINEWGNLQLEEIDQPTPASDEVLVRVRASSVNPIDSIVLAGYLQSMLTLPMTAGTDFAGDVVAVGADVTHVKPGDAVYGMIALRGGAFAEYVTPKGDEVSQKPTSLDYVQSAALPLISMTAWQAVIDLAQVQSGERVLIHGAGGSVGSIAVQLVKNLDAYVIAHDMPEKKNFLQDLGVDEFVSASDQRFEDVAKDIDVVLNFASNDLMERSYNVLYDGGRYVPTTQMAPPEGTPPRDIRNMGVAAKATPEKLAEIARLIDEGKLKVFVQETFPLHEAQNAMNQRQTTLTMGKIVLTVD